MTDHTTTNTTTDATVTDDAAFFTPPALNDHHKPGDILRLRPISPPRLPAGPAWQILYVSQDSHGARIPVSGTVITPSGTGLDHDPILIYYPSFHGLGGEHCAPSQLIADGGEPDTDQISAVLARGWPVAVVDGEGLGVRGHGPHTLLAGRAAGQIMLDMGRAVRKIPALNAAERPLLLWGYADGGRASVWAGELHTGYAPELDVRGIAAGAVPTDPGAIARQLDGGPWSGLGLAGLIGLSHAYSHLPLRHVLTSTARQLLADAETSTMSRLCERYQVPLAVWCERADPPWDDPLWKYVLSHEILSASAFPAAPIHLYHGRADTVIPIEFGRGLYLDYRARGAQVSWREYQGNHVRTAGEATKQVLSRLAEYLTATGSACA
ncbi:fermentation-respiration switch protein FrsA (DUF1100 family) [Nocardia sp. GAS34]|uniref:lipase family protein n=1 Tax=unclassified Nocardia TaxID=2637762 RepID=UPI003D193E6C